MHIFKAILEVKEESREEIIEKLRVCYFMVRRRDKTDQMKFIINKKSAETFHCNPKWVKTGTIYEIVSENKERLSRGEIEGFIVENLKWKAAHYIQPVVERR